MKAWLQLVRLPNVFTAIADVMMGYLVTHGSLQPAPHFVLITAASCLLYMSGMALNDAFDADVDARDRPDRPVPSGRITKRAAIVIGFALLASGMLTTWFIAIITQGWRPAIIGTLLAACVILYDYTLKRTIVAPLAMGACRSLNVLLGMSLAAETHPANAMGTQFVEWGSTAAWLIATGIGCYVVGVTWFARTEARDSSRAQLNGGLIVLLGGIGILAAVPYWTQNVPPLALIASGWYLLWTYLVVVTVNRCGRAVYNPASPNVQAAVRHCIQSIIVFDAVVTVGYASPSWGFAVVVLLVPMMTLAARLKVT